MKLVSSARPKGSDESQLSAFPKHRATGTPSRTSSPQAGKSGLARSGTRLNSRKSPGRSALETLPSFDEHYSSYPSAQRTIAQCNDRGSVFSETTLNATWGLFNPLERASGAGMRYLHVEAVSPLGALRASRHRSQCDLDKLQSHVENKLTSTIVVEG